VPDPPPAVQYVSGGTAGPGGLPYTKAGDPIAIGTTGGFDYAIVKFLVGSYKGGSASNPTTVRPDAHGVLRYSVPSYNTVTPLAGPACVSVEFYLDALPPPEFNMSAYLSSGLPPVNYVNVPMLSAAVTPGAPTVPGYDGVVFPDVDFEISGSQLMVDGFQPSVRMGNTPLEVRPGSNPTRLVARIPASATGLENGAQGRLIVNNGFLESLDSNFLWGSKVWPTAALPRVSGLTPNTVKKSVGSYTTTINGDFLGFLAESVSINGVEGTIEARGTTTVAVKFSNYISTGDIVLKTRAGEAMPISPGACRLTIVP
jgi:hypothetical protein